MQSIDSRRPSLYSEMPVRIEQLFRTGPIRILSHALPYTPQTSRHLFTQVRRISRDGKQAETARLTHVTDSGSAHMVSIAEKNATPRVAKAACTVRFSNKTAVGLIRENQMKKGDVLGVARIAGIMAAKRTSDLIPLCHPIPISKVTLDLDMGEESTTIEIEATVTCDGKTGVEMEALTAASTAALTVYDMCKAVDKGMVIEGLRVILKDGGKSGRWEMA